MYFLMKVIYVLSIVFWILCAISLILFNVFQFLMIFNRKPGIKFFDPRFLYNIFHIQFFGDKYLTNRGLHWRKLSYNCFLYFILAWCLTAILMLIHNQL